MAFFLTERECPGMLSKSNGCVDSTTVDKKLQQITIIEPDEIKS